MVRRSVWAVIAIVIIIIIVVGSVIYFMSISGPSLTPTKTAVLYAGEVNATAYGFGLTQNSITSPGPTLSFKIGDVVNMTVYDVSSTISHAWALTNAPQQGATVLFGAQIASASSPLPPGGSGWVVFNMTEAGNFYYICPVSGHVALGMWGNVTVTAS